MGLIDTIREKHADAVRRRCQESGCRLGMTEVGEHVILRGEALVTHGRACDCVVIVDTDPVTVPLVELKGRNPRAAEVREQLVGAWDGCKQVLQTCGVTERDCEVFPILLAKSYSNRRLLAELRKTRVDVSGRHIRIAQGKCGEALMPLIEKSRSASN